MEVVIPTRPTMDFDFNSARSSLSVTAPSTPRRFGDYYMSAPTSPSRMSEFYREFDEFSDMSNWEDDEPPHATDVATTKSPKPKKEDEFGFDDFAFDVSEEVERTSLSAEELFDGGVLRPFKPPPTTASPRSPSFFRQVLSPRRKKGKDLPIGASPQMENTTKRSDQQQQRGRDRAPAALSSSVSGRRATRSLSPLRVSEFQWEEEEKQYQQKQQQQQQQQQNNQLAPKALFSSSTSASKASRKWKLKDFLLFRSASEGRATDKDPFRKYSTLFKKNEDVGKNSSFRSIDSPASVSSSRRRGPVSAHELHYTVNKAVSDDLKKKTFLPYKQGILGRLAFNPAVNALANGFGSLSRS